MKVKTGFWVLLTVVGLLYFTVLELSKNTIPGWIVAALVFIGYALLEQKLLRGQNGWIRFAGWVAFLMVLVLVSFLSRPPFRKVPAVDVPNPEVTEVITISQGQLTGVYNEDRSVEVYAGIPYAKPPVGDLRWKEPQDPEGWEGVRACDHFAPMSMQKRQPAIYDSIVQIMIYHDYRINLRDNYREPVSEDSLYLNIWKPEGDIKDAPVLVFIHGGSLMTGQTYFSEYNGETLAKEGIVVVNFAYRLGPFGYLATEELAAESPNGTTGNYGLLDQVKALEWVQKNIAAFGGDPARVTIAGESAGSSSVNALCVSPLSEGMFRYAIGESSGIVARKPFHTFRDLPDALDMGKKLMEEMGATTLQELRRVDADVILNTAYRHDSMTVDGYAITKQPYLTYEKGENHEQALLNGFNAHEADVFNFFYKVTSDNYLDYLRNDFGEYAEQVAALYPAGTIEVANHYPVELGGDAKGEINMALSGAWFAYSHYRWSHYMMEQNRPVYMYYFTKDNNSLGANHAGELPYAYGNLWRHGTLYNESDQRLSDAMVQYWANFVKTGDPNGEGLVSWPPYEEGKDKVLELGEEIAPTEDPFWELYSIIDQYEEQ